MWEPVWTKSAMTEGFGHRGTIKQELLNDTYKHIAEQYEMKGNLKKAEHYYVEAGQAKHGEPCLA